jgi:hypothetical protein
MKARLLREAMSPPLLAGSWGAVVLEEGEVSPVRLDSSTARSLAWGGGGGGSNTQLAAEEVEQALVRSRAPPSGASRCP